LAATTLRAFAYQVLVDCYGEVPYKEALNPSILSPRYDEGLIVYKGILAELDEALGRVSGSEVVATNFLFPSATVGKWIQFANALKLRILMRMSNVQNVHSQLVSLIAENNFPTEDICFANCWANESGKANPFFWEELEIVKHLSKKGSYWFFHFPEPEREPEAIYGMVVQDENKEWFYYTLEMGRDQFFF
jgi:hypothetical protein